MTASATEAVAGGPDDTDRAFVVVVGQGYVGLPLAVGAAEAGHDVVGFDVEASGSAARRGRFVRRGHPRWPPRRRLGTGRFRPTDSAADLAGFEVGIIAVPTPLGRRDRRTCRTSKPPRSTLGAQLRPGACVVLESSTYPGTTEDLVGPAPRSRVGAHRRPGFPPGLQSRAHRSRQRPVDARHHPQAGLGDERRIPGRRAALLRHHRRQDHLGVGHPRGGAGQAPREHLPQRECSPGERDRHLRPGSRRRHLGGDRGRGHQALRLHALHAGPWAWAGTACRAIRAISRGTCASRWAGRHGWSRWPTRSTSRCPTYVVARLTADPAAARRSRWRAGGSCCSASPTRRTAGTPASRRPSRWPAGWWRPERWSAPLIPMSTPPSTSPGSAVWSSTPAELAEADTVVLLTAHDAFDHDLVVSTATFVFDARGRLSGPNVERL